MWYNVSMVQTPFPFNVHMTCPSCDKHINSVGFDDKESYNAFIEGYGTGAEDPETDCCPSCGDLGTLHEGAGV